MEIFQNFSKHDELNKALSDTLNYANLQSSPRVIKTHLPIGMLPPNILEECKVVYVSRCLLLKFRSCEKATKFEKNILLQINFNKSQELNIGLYC